MNLPFDDLKLGRRAMLICACTVAMGVAAHVLGQEAGSGDDEPEEVAAASVAAPPPAGRSPRPTVWDLMLQGGVFMIPILGCSVVVVAFTIERAIGLRRRKVIPPRLVAGLEEQTSQANGLDPRVAYRLCQQYPSPMAHVLRAGLMKIGRPHAEVEKAVEDSGAREAAALFRNVRPLNACASIGPLLGLIGTVQGMIMAFIVTSTTTATGSAKAQELAQGIYTALVTTFAGLCVAIPAVLFAHYFEGWIERLVREIEEIMVEIMPHLERYEGKVRLKPAVRAKEPEPPAAVKQVSAPAQAVRGAKSERAAAPDGAAVR